MRDGRLVLPDAPGLGLRRRRRERPGNVSGTLDVLGVLREVGVRPRA